MAFGGKSVADAVVSIEYWLGRAFIEGAYEMEFSSITEALKHWAYVGPDKICFVDVESGGTCTYRQMWRWSTAFAERLQALGLERGACVTVRVGGLIETNVAMFATFLAGGIYCPVEQHMKEMKLKELLREYDAKILLSSDLIEWDGVSISLAEVISDSYDEREWPLPKPEDAAIIVFTTGTTGKAKGVVHSHRSHARGPRGWVNEWGMGREDVFFSVQPLERAGGMFHYYSAIWAGGTAVHHGGVVFVTRVFDAIRQYGVTVMYIQAPALQMLIDADAVSFFEVAAQLRILGVGGTVVPEPLKENLVRNMPKTYLYILYAASEYVWISYYTFNNLLGKANCVGKAAPGNKIFISDYETSFTHAGRRTGIITVRSDNIFIGYYGDSELYSKTVVDGDMFMTDIGYMDDEGYLYILGRRDDVIVTGGYKVAPYEIEDVAARMEGVLECACIGVPNKVLGQAPRLFVRMEKGAQFSAKRISQFLEPRLEKYKLPRSINEVEDFPRIGETPKIDRRELKNL